MAGEARHHNVSHPDDLSQAGQYEAAYVALACESFRLAHKRWPETLAALTPAFLEELPPTFEEPACCSPS